MAHRTTCSPGEHSHSDQPNFTVETYLLDCLERGVQPTIAEVARVTGVSRSFIYRCILFASVPEDEFETVLEETLAAGKTSVTAMADAIKRHTGNARTYVERCPHCGGALRERRR